MSQKILLCSLLLIPGTLSAEDTVKPPTAVQEIIARTNQFRQKNKLPAVKSAKELTAAAQYFADFMAKTDKYGHEADAKTPSARAKAHKYEHCLMLENIAYQFSSAGFTTNELSSKFFTGWKESPGHRKNMLYDGATETGVAVAQSPTTKRWYAVQMFGRPQSDSIKFAVSNQSEQTVSYKLGDASYTLKPRYVRTHTRCGPTALIFPKGALGDFSADLQAANGKQYTVAPSDSGGLSLTTGKLE